MALESDILAIECDSRVSIRESALTRLSDEFNAMGGWSHLNGVGQFANAAHPVSAYRIGGEAYQEDPSCNGAKTLETVLVKKTWDWDRNHANGMETSFPNEGIDFGHVTDLVLEIRIDSERSSIPSAGELEDAYAEFLSAEDLAELDNQQVNLELTLFGEGATADQPHMNASAMVAVDPAQFADQWVRVQVSREDFSWYTEDNYQRTEVGADEYQDLRVRGLRINPETGSGLTARHYIGDDFDPQARDELFKEMAITFALIEVGHSQ